ncbi:AMP-binding protein [Streptomyces sp. M19]
MDLLHRWQRATGVPIREAFGMTELAPIAGQPPGSPPAPAPWAARALVELRVLGDGPEPLPPGTPGEIVVRAPHLFRGYRNRPDETAAALSGGWLRTGDLGRLDEDGYLHIVGRKKDMIIVAGAKVYPREIDEVLATHPGSAGRSRSASPIRGRGAARVLRRPGPRKPAGPRRVVQALRRAPGAVQAARLHRGGPATALTAADTVDRRALHALWNACPHPTLTENSARVVRVPDEPARRRAVRRDRSPFTGGTAPKMPTPIRRDTHAHRSVRSHATTRPHRYGRVLAGRRTPDPDRMRDEWRRGTASPCSPSARAGTPSRSRVPRSWPPRTPWPRRRSSPGRANRCCSAPGPVHPGRPGLGGRARHAGADRAAARRVDRGPRPGADAFSPVRWLTLPDGTGQFMDAKRLYATCQCCHRRTVRAV